jgi:hypothetical protein
MVTNAAACQRPFKPTSTKGSAWAARPHGEKVQMRTRTLGDGTTMLVPAPGVVTNQPHCFMGRETAVLKEAHNLFMRSTFAEHTEQQQRNRRPDTWSASSGSSTSRMPPHLLLPLPSTFALPGQVGPERLSTRPKLQGHNFRAGSQ